MAKKKKLTLKQKQAIKTYIITGAILYLVLGFYVLHAMYLMQNLGYGLLHACNQAFNHMIIHPLVILPFPVGYFKVMFLIIVGTLFAVWIVYTSAKMREHEDPDIVAGDAKWMEDLEEYNKQFTYPFGSAETADYKNIIFANELHMSTDTEKTGRTLNTLVIGGSGVGKSFRLIGPNLMQRNTSYVVTDPSGDLYKRYAPYLEYFGYRIKVFNLDHMEKSNHYNPFRYINSDKDIEILVTMIIENTKRPDSGHGDEFWEKCEEALISAVIAYLYHFGSVEEQNMSNVLRLIKSANVDESKPWIKSTLDTIMDDVREKDPDGFTISQYDTFRLGAGKTLKSILISCAVRLKAFELEDVRRLTDTDDINLSKIADERTAIFIIVPTGEKTFNYIAGLMYAQLFSQLYHYCENEAQYNYILQDSDGEVAKVFRAKTRRDRVAAKEEAKEFMRKLQGAKIVEKPEMRIEEEDDDEEAITYEQIIKETTSEKSGTSSHDRKNKSLSFWQILDADNNLIAFRGTKELAEKALEKMKKGAIIPASKTSQKGQRCPIHVRFLLDEFANTGKVPDFTEKLSTMRKKQISATIILQSLTQIKNMYETEWSNISANCDTTMYLGGGIDLETTEWLSTVLDTKTVRAMSSSLSGTGGSQSFQSQGIPLYSLSQLRTMPNQQCIVLPRGYDPYKGPMYDTPKHPGWSLLEKLPSYEYSDYRRIFFASSFGDKTKTETSSLQTSHGIPPETPAADDQAYIDNENKKSKQAALEVKANTALDGNKKIGEKGILSPNAPAEAQNHAFNVAATSGAGNAAGTAASPAAGSETRKRRATRTFDDDIDYNALADSKPVANEKETEAAGGNKNGNNSGNDAVDDYVMDDIDMVVDFENMSFSEAKPQI